MKYNIWNKELKRYLTGEDMNLVRVNAEGCVEKLYIDTLPTKEYNKKRTSHSFILSSWTECGAKYVEYAEWILASELEVRYDPDDLREKIALALSENELLYCSRVWYAWGYGTMTQADFHDASDDVDIIDNIVNTILGNGHRNNSQETSGED